MTQIQDNQNFRVYILKTILFVAILLIGLSSLTNLVLYSNIPLLLLNLFAILLLVLAIRTSKIWLFHSGIRLLFMVIFSFVFLPIDWYFSIGVRGSLPYYALVLILCSNLFLESTAQRILLPAGILMEILLFFIIELFWPSMHKALYTEGAILYSLMSNFMIAAVIILVMTHMIHQQFEKNLSTLYKISITDSLTGVYNRRYMMKRLEDISNHSKRRDESFYLLYIDIDAFKKINDRDGHNKGDQILNILADVLRYDLRSYDIPGRIGGDEFIVILPDTSYEQAREVANRMIALYERMVQERFGIYSTISIGIAQGDNKDLTDLLGEADSSMYRQKHEESK